jgi:holin-like protein
MLLLAALLQMKVIKLEWVKGMSDFLISNMGFFFVPPGVALMLYLDLIKAEFLPIAVATVVSTVLVLIVTGWTHQKIKVKDDK